MLAEKFPAKPKKEPRPSCRPARPTRPSKAKLDEDAQVIHDDSLEEISSDESPSASRPSVGASSLPAPGLTRDPSRRQTADTGEVQEVASSSTAAEHQDVGPIGSLGFERPPEETGGEQDRLEGAVEKIRKLREELASIPEGLQRPPAEQEGVEGISTAELEAIQQICRRARVFLRPDTAEEAYEESNEPARLEESRKELVDMLVKLDEQLTVDVTVDATVAVTVAVTADVTADLSADPSAELSAELTAETADHSRFLHPI